MSEVDILKRRLEETDKLYLEKCKEVDKLREQIKTKRQQSIEDIMAIACDEVCKWIGDERCENCPLENAILNDI